MKKRFVLLMLSTIVLLLLIVPAANAVWVGGIDPWRADPGQTLGCTVTGTFAPDGLGSAPEFELIKDAVTITGATVTMWDAGSAYTTFAIPRTAPPGVYELYTSQTVGGVLERDYFAGAFTVNDLTPHITSTNPGYSYVGDPDQNVHVFGYGFQDTTPGHQGSVVKFDGVAMPTTFVSTTELLVAFYYTCFQTPGSHIVTVTNVADDWTSGSWPYTVIMPTPTLDTLDRTSVEAGSGDIQITALGSEFATVAVMSFGGTDLTTYVDGPTRLRGTVPASLLTSPGTVNVTIRNGGAGAPVSGALTFTINAGPVATPVISFFEPATVTVGDRSQPLRVHGSGFVSSSQVAWTLSSGAGLAVVLGTTYVSTSLLTAVVSTDFVSVARTLYVSVVNPGGVRSAEMPFTITALAPSTPVLSYLDPASVTAGSAGRPIKVAGSGFDTSADGAVVVWNGSVIVPSERSSSNQLMLNGTAEMFATPGTATVQVRNGGAGAAVSNTLTFTITGGGGGGGAFALTSLEPTQVWAGYGGPGVILAVNGSGFVSGAHIWLGTQEKVATTFVSATRLTTTLLPADLASVGTIQVSVKNPGGVAGPSTLPLAVSTETTDPTVTITGADSGWHNVPVTLTFAGADAQSGVQKVQYRCPPAVGGWTDGTSYAVPVTTQGVISVSAQAVDWCGRVGSAAATVKIDTTKPGTDALTAVGVKRGKIAKLRFRVSEPSDLSPTATVVLQVRKGSKVVKRKTLSGVPMNATETYSFKVALKKGSYRWYVSATDLAGNAQANSDWAAFTVR